MNVRLKKKEIDTSFEKKRNKRMVKNSYLASGRPFFPYYLKTKETEDGTKK